MTPETLAPPDMTRFTTHKDDLVAFEAAVIVALAVYVMILHWMYGGERKEMRKTMDTLAQSIPVLTEVMRNATKK